MAKKKTSDGPTIKLAGLAEASVNMSHIPEGTYLLRIKGKLEDRESRMDRYDENSEVKGTNYSVETEIVEVRETKADFEPENLVGVPFYPRWFVMAETHPSYDKPQQRGSGTVGENMNLRVFSDIKTMYFHATDPDTGASGDLVDGDEIDVESSIGREVVARITERPSDDGAVVFNEVRKWTSP